MPLLEALTNSIVNSIGRKNEQKRHEIDIADNVNNVVQAVENSVEFRTNKPLTTTKKFGKLIAVICLIAQDFLNVVLCLNTY